jgi:hypothetical protein
MVLENLHSFFDFLWYGLVLIWGLFCAFLRQHETNYIPIRAGILSGSHNFVLKAGEATANRQLMSRVGNPDIGTFHIIT